MRLSQSQTQSRVDREKNEVNGVSVISVGPAKGHSALKSGRQYALYVDETTLEECLAYMQTHEPLIVHYEHTGSDGSRVKNSVGYIVNPRIDGQQLRATLKLYDCPQDELRKLYSIIENTPHALGLSIEFAEAEHEYDTQTMRAYARILEISAADLVSDPAANHTGLFHRGTKDMEQNTNEVALATVLGAFMRHLSESPPNKKEKDDSAESETETPVKEPEVQDKDELLQKIAALEEKLAKLEEAKLEEKTEAKPAADTGLQALEILKSLASANVSAGFASPQQPQKKEPGSFDEAYKRELEANPNVKISEVVRKYPELHAKARSLGCHVGFQRRL